MEPSAETKASKTPAAREASNQINVSNKRNSKFYVFLGK